MLCRVQNCQQCSQPDRCSNCNGGYDLNPTLNQCNRESMDLCRTNRVDTQNNSYIWFIFWFKFTLNLLYFFLLNSSMLQRSKLSSLFVSQHVFVLQQRLLPQWKHLPRWTYSLRICSVLHQEIINVYNRSTFTAVRCNILNCQTCSAPNTCSVCNNGFNLVQNGICVGRF